MSPVVSVAEIGSGLKEFESSLKLLAWSSRPVPLSPGKFNPEAVAARLKANGIKTSDLSQNQSFRETFFLPDRDVLIRRNLLSTALADIPLVRDYSAWIETQSRSSAAIIPGLTDFSLDLVAAGAGIINPETFVRRTNSRVFTYLSFRDKSFQPISRQFNIPKIQPLSPENVYAVWSKLLTAEKPRSKDSTRSNLP